MKNCLEKNEYFAVLWGPIKHRWTDILENVNKDGVDVTDACVYRPEDVSDDSWRRFVINCYLSHELIDNPKVNVQSKVEKIKKKLKYEHLLLSDRELCIFKFRIVDSRKITETIVHELKSNWEYSDQRISDNRIGLISSGAPYELNIVKDIVRKRFCHDEKLLPYYKGEYAGRKRIMHSPVTVEGCKALLNFVLTHPHIKDKINNEC